jgi:hypothetical protein
MMNFNETTNLIDSTFFNLLYPLISESIVKRKVLLVENDIELSSTVEAFLSEDPQIELQLARDADEAMILMIHNKYDLIVMEDHQHSPSLHHPGYIYKSDSPASILSDIRGYFSHH